MSDPVPPLLAVDQGNSSLKGALVRGARVSPLFQVAPGESFCAKDLEGLRAFVASVAPARLPALEAALREATGRRPLVLGRDLRVPLRSAYKTPQTLGVDRLLGALAAWRASPQGAVIVDAGTALTVDLVDGQGVFRGGAIAPGPALLEAALKAGAAALEWGGLDPSSPWPASSSRACCVTGLTATLAGQVRELLSRAREEVGLEMPVILTGGAGPLVARLLPELRFLPRPHLVLEGIACSAQSWIRDRCSKDSKGDA